MKNKLTALLAKKEARKTELNGKLATANEVELRSIIAELETLNGEITEYRSMIAGIPDEVVPVVVPEQRGTVPAGKLDPLATYAVGSAPMKITERSTDFAQMSYEDVCGAPEYRSAYLKRLQHKRLDETEDRALTAETEKRAVTTGAGSAGAAVPTTTYNKILEKLRQTSVLFPLIQATYIPGNVTLPVANALNSALWSDEATGTATGDDTVAGVSLSGFTLAKYSTLSIAVETMSVDAFEAYIVNQLGAQLSIAVENAILNGLGPTPGGGLKAQPTGVLPGLAFAWTAANSLTYSIANGLGYDDLVNTRTLLRSMYRPGAVFAMNTNMEGMLMKIKSSTGKPIFSQDPQNGFIQKILNLPYVVDDYMPDATILLSRWDYYYMNFSQAPVIEADKSAGFSIASIIYRGLLIADGKPASGEAFVKLAGV